jgi:hypothetical protein
MAKPSEERRIMPRGKHGLSKTPEYKIWITSKHRCFNAHYKTYSYYGGRGITMCSRWRESFKNFYADMGPRPSNKHSLDRINNDGNYEPDNCRWATHQQQMENRRAYSFSKIKGVCWRQKTKKWRVSILINGKKVHFGHFDDLNEAKKISDSVYASRK